MKVSKGRRYIPICNRFTKLADFHGTDNLFSEYEKLLYYLRMSPGKFYRLFASPDEHYKTNLNTLEQFKKARILQMTEEFPVKFESPVFLIRIDKTKRGISESMTQISKMVNYYDELVGAYLSDADEDFLYRSMQAHRRIISDTMDDPAEAERALLVQGLINEYEAEYFIPRFLTEPRGSLAAQIDEVLFNKLMAWFSHEKPKGRKIEINKQHILLSNRKRQGFDPNLNPPVLSDVSNPDKKSQMALMTMTPEEKQRLKALWQESVQIYSERNAEAAKKALKQRNFLALKYDEVKEIGSKRDCKKYLEIWEDAVQISTYDFGQKIVGVPKSQLFKIHQSGNKKNRRKIPDNRPIEVSN